MIARQMQTCKFTFTELKTVMIIYTGLATWEYQLPYRTNTRQLM